MAAVGHFATQTALTQFKEGLDLIFLRWSALQIVIEHNLGGQTTLGKVAEMATHTVNFFIQHGSDVAPYELAENLHGFFEESFDAGLEDGSASQVAAMLVTLFAECVAGRSDLLTKLTTTAIRPSAKQSRMMLADSDYEDSDEEDDGSDDDDEEDDIMDDSEGTKVEESAPTPSKPDPVIDEDGFELVQKRRR